MSKSVIIHMHVYGETDLEKRGTLRVGKELKSSSVCKAYLVAIWFVICWFHTTDRNIGVRTP